jgi:putative hemolysin
MKNILLTIILYLLVVNVYSQNKVIPNPASLYVRFLGYKSEMKTDSYGNQVKVCIFPNNTECDEWSFFRGKCGSEFSYCAQKGCVAETDSTDTAQFGVCVSTDSLGRKIKIPIIDFMMQHGDTLYRESRIDRR